MMRRTDDHSESSISLGLFNFNLPFKAQSGYIPATDLATRLSDVLAILLLFEAIQNAKFLLTEF
jgi:hypothetical protein